MIDLLKLAVGPVVGYFKKRAELKGLEHTQKSEIIKRKTEIISDKVGFNHAWELAAMQADEAGHLRLVSFYMFNAIIIFACYDPVEAQKIWVALDAIPKWIVTVQLSMIAFIWAAKPLANLGAGLIQKGK